MARIFADDTFAHRKIHPVYGDFSRAYFPTVFGDGLTDLSFLVMEGDAPVLLVPCSLHDDILSSYGFPIRFILRNGVSASDERKAIAAAFQHLEETAPTSGVAQARISGGSTNGVLSLVDRACLDHGGRAGLRMRAEASLSLSEDELRQDIRASYRSLINWGRRNLRLVYVNQENPDRGLLDDYSDFHARVARRVVHGEATWLAVFNHIVAGGGEIAMGYLEETGDLVSAAMVADEEDTALYFSAVYDRERFDKPMGHWPLFDAMLRAKARGRRYFDLGEFFSRGAVSDKEFNIGFFKKGFTSRHPVEVVWSVPFRDKS
jgi:hypothetical protein